jgi:hypothetical protein
MKKSRELCVALILAVSTAVFATALAQDTAKNEPKKKSESCCTMDCCRDCPCCQGDSCEMKSDAKEHSSRHNCCCCGGACEMKNVKNKEKRN